MVEGGARQARLHRLQPERARPDDRVGLLGAGAAGRDGLGAGHLGRAAGGRDRGLHDGDDAGALREARRRAGRDRRRGLRPARPPRLGRARGGGGRRRGAVPAELPEDARRAAPRPALARTPFLLASSGILNSEWASTTTSPAAQAGLFRIPTALAARPSRRSTSCSASPTTAIPKFGGLPSRTCAPASSNGTWESCGIGSWPSPTIP